MSISELHKLRNAVINGNVEALINLQRQATMNVPYAQYLLGEMYYLGEGLEKSFEEALRWLCLGVDAGSPEAMLTLAYFLDPNYIFADPIFEAKRSIKCEKFSTYLRTSAFTIFMSRKENEEIYVAKWIADCYQMGWGCQQDMEKCREWEKKCPPTPYP